MEDAQQYPNRRQHERVQFDEETWIYFDDPSDFREVMVRDLSMGGMFIAEDPPPLGTIVQVQMHVGELGKIDISGRVIRHARQGDYDGYGIEFLDPPEALATLMNELLADKTPPEDD